MSAALELLDEWQVSPHDLPSGYGEAGRIEYLRWCIEHGQRRLIAVLERELRDGFPTLMFTPADAILYDAGMEHYGEFFCSLPTALRLLEDGMTFNGQPGGVRVIARFTNGAQMKWSPS